ncbi:MAG TPA: UDP-N-acetylmuramate--L-alanine ligase [Clostridiaceae bacterium]|nr:UDP-N-acetylmuramate--L-alanine ligase [Clostridiaceae bacterium]
MSGLAEILISLGYKVSGSDVKTSNKTLKLEKMGAKIIPYHSEENIDNQDLVVYTAAINHNNPELQKARKLNIPTIDRATLLGMIMKKYNYRITVSGTHGKTTTTSMISTIMMESGLDPTVHIGAELESIGGTTRLGSNNYMVAEACEYQGSFLKFHPNMAVILNIEYDHADYFKNIEHVKEYFLKFSNRIPQDGYIVACVDDPNVSWLLDKLSCNKITFGIKSENALWSATNIKFDSDGTTTYTLLKNKKEITGIKLQVTGMHNVSNSLGAIAACNALGCSIASIKSALLKFTGVHQRFELKGVINNIRVFDDYAHHPSEIKATLKSAKNCNPSKIWCVFQPHTYSRAKYLLDEFATSFSDADVVIISDIYAARELDTGEIHSSMLVKKINSYGEKAIYISDFTEIAKYLHENASPGDIVVTMGAGNISKVGEIFLQSEGIKAVS